MMDRRVSATFPVKISRRCRYHECAASRREERGITFLVGGQSSSQSVRSSCLYVEKKNKSLWVNTTKQIKDDNNIKKQDRSQSEKE